MEKNIINFLKYNYKPLELENVWIFGLMSLLFTFTLNSLWNQRPSISPIWVFIILCILIIGHIASYKKSVLWENLYMGCMMLDISVVSHSLSLVFLTFNSGISAGDVILYVIAFLLSCLLMLKVTIHNVKIDAFNTEFKEKPKMSILAITAFIVLSPTIFAHLNNEQIYLFTAILCWMIGFLFSSGLSHLVKMYYIVKYKIDI